MSLHGRKRKRVINKHVREHGWHCYYCGAPLVHEDNIKQVCLYEPEVVSWTHCGCGEHDLSKEPCVRGGAWYIPDDSPYRWFEIEHKIPRSRGGSDALSNLCLSCGECNNRKGTRTSDEYIALRAAT